jgi:hypothetical protein
MADEIKLADGESKTQRIKRLTKEALETRGLLGVVATPTGAALRSIRRSTRLERGSTGSSGA